MAERTGKQSRDNETREKEEVDPSAGYRPPSNLPTPDDQDGYCFRWVRASIGGEADNRNISMRMREGWEPVKAEDHPELMLISDRGTTFEGGIEVGGLVLCKTLRENMEKREAYYADKAHQQQVSVDQNFMRESDPRMPLLPTEHSTQTTFGTGRPPRGKG